MCDATSPTTAIEVASSVDVIGSWAGDPCDGSEENVASNKHKCIASFESALTVAIPGMIVHDVDTSYGSRRRLASGGRSLLVPTVTYSFKIAKAVETGSNEDATLLALQSDLTAQLGT